MGETKTFSGRESRGMWECVNEAGTAIEVRDALYLVCCRLQNLEDELRARLDVLERSEGAAIADAEPTT